MIHYDHMSLQETIRSGIKDAMKAKDSVRLTVLRGLSTAFMNELVATNRTPQSELSDEETIAVINREAKKRKDSIAQFTNGGRLDLVDIEEAELNILKEFLPVPMAHAEIIPIINAKIAQLNADKSKAGMVTGLVMKELKGKADGDDVKKLVDELLA